MSEFGPKGPKGIDLRGMPGYSFEHTRLAEVVRFFEGELQKKTMSFHFGPYSETIQTSSPIHWASVMENGNVVFVCNDVYGNPEVHEFDGGLTGIQSSIYEENDVVFTASADYLDPNAVWAVIYDTTVNAQYTKLD